MFDWWKYFAQADDGQMAFIRCVTCLAVILLERQKEDDYESPPDCCPLCK